MSTPDRAAVPGYIFDAGGRIVGARCRRCGAVSVPARPYHCDEATESASVEPRGRVESWTVIRAAPDRFPVPYRMAYVRLDAGPRVLARLEGADAGADPGGRPVVLAADKQRPGRGLTARLT